VWGGEGLRRRRGLVRLFDGSLIVERDRVDTWMVALLYLLHG